MDEGKIYVLEFLTVPDLYVIYAYVYVTFGLDQ